MLKLRKNKKGFTLVELIVVIAIMAVLAGTIAGVTVSQLNKQTNNTAKSEAQTLASDLYNFMIDYTLPDDPGKTPGTTTGFEMPEGEQWNITDGINTVGELTYAVYAFVFENNQGANIKVFSLGKDATTAPKENGDIEGDDNKGKYKEGESFVSLKAGEHKFYAVVYKTEVVVGEDTDGKDIKEDRYKVRFCCLQKGKGQNQFPFADYTYGDVLADK